MSRTAGTPPTGIATSVAKGSAAETIDVAPSGKSATGESLPA